MRARRLPIRLRALLFNTWWSMRRAFVTAADDSTVRLWSLDPHFCLAGKSLRTAARALDFSPDGKWLAAGLSNGTVLVMDAARGPDGDFGFEVMAELADRTSPVTTLRYSPTGTHLAVGSRGKTVDLYRVDAKGTGQCRLVATMAGHSSRVTSLDFTDDGMHLQVRRGCVFHMSPSLTLPSMSADKLGCRGAALLGRKTAKTGSGRWGGAARCTLGILDQLLGLASDRNMAFRLGWCATSPPNMRPHTFSFLCTTTLLSFTAGRRQVPTSTRCASHRTGE